MSESKQISKKQFEKAHKIVKGYLEKCNESLIRPLTCICCKQTEIKPVSGTGLSEGMIKASEQEKGCWDNGTVDKISFGYGSIHDGDSFYIAVCDKCIEQLKKHSIIVDRTEIRIKERNLGLPAF